MTTRAMLAAMAAVMLLGAGPCGNGRLVLRHTADSEMWPYSGGANPECWEWQSPSGDLVTMRIDNKTRVTAYYVTDSGGTVVGKTTRIDCADVSASRVVVLPDGGTVSRTRQYRGQVSWPCQMWPILPGGRCTE